MLGELTSTQIEDLLRTEVFGRIGCHAEGHTYVVPITYVYDGGCVYGHSVVGTKIDMMRQNPEVCFEVEHVHDYANWRCVIATGVYEELDGVAARDAARVLQERLAHRLPSSLARPLPHELDPTDTIDLDRSSGDDAPPTVIYRIRLDDKSGRFERR